MTNVDSETRRLTTPRLRDRLREQPDPQIRQKVVVYLAGPSPAPTQGQPSGCGSSALRALEELGLSFAHSPGSRVVRAEGNAEQLQRLESLPDIDLIDLQDPVVVEIDTWDDESASREGTERTASCSELTGLLEQARGRNGIASLALFVRDTWWGDGGFRLTASSGVNHIEPLLAGAFTPVAQNIVWREGADEEWFANAADSECLKGTLADRDAGSKALLAQICAKQPFYGGFHTREGIASCARLLGRVGGEVVLSLFANFASQVAFDDALKRDLGALRDELVDRYPGALAESPPAVFKQRMPQLLASIDSLANTCFDPSVSNLHEAIRSLLRSCLKSVSPTAAEYASLHLYRGETGMLELMSWASESEPKHRPPRGDHQRLAEGRGVLTWVALRGQPLILGDVTGSDFARGVYREIYDGVRSELAVPLFAGKRLVGVLNLESTVPNAFRPESVRFVSYLGNLAVIACELARSGRTEAALDEYGEALELAAPDEGPRESRHDRWATYVARKLGAFRCSVWEAASEGGFVRCGAYNRHSDDPAAHPEPAVRPGGWTSYVAATGRPVWIARIEGPDRFEAVWWDDAKMMWTPTPPTAPDRVPKAVNFERIGPAVRCELGIPLKHKGACVGVAWLKYDRDQPPGGSRVFESWVSGDVRLVGYHLFKRPTASGSTAGEEPAAVPPTVYMRIVEKVSEVPGSFAHPPSGC